MHHRYLYLGMAGVALLAGGCGTTNVNPAKPRANTGYVDFYSDSALNLSWEVKRADERTGELRTVYSEFKPLKGILRVAAPPGTQQFQVWFMNQSTPGPEQVQVNVENGKVTPVRVNLTPAGTASVQEKVYGFRPSIKGYGRGTKFVNEQSGVFEVSAVAEAPQAYQPKERTSYFSAAPK